VIRPTPAVSYRQKRKDTYLDTRTLELLERLIMKDTYEHVALLSLFPEFGRRRLSEASALSALLVLGAERVESEAKRLFDSRNEE
jgi:hypothetical protein